MRAKAAGWDKNNVLFCPMPIHNPTVVWFLLMNRRVGSYFRWKCLFLRTIPNGVMFLKIAANVTFIIAIYHMETCMQKQRHEQHVFM